MSYSHYFYATDLQRLQNIFGSREKKPVRELADARPELAPFLDAIINGEIDHELETAGYGYMLMAICELIGTQIGDEVSDVRDHPCESRLANSGPPLPIPYDPVNFPQIGFLTATEVQDELDRIDASKGTQVNRKIAGKRKGSAAQMAAAIADDVRVYRKTLLEALALGLGVVSFRH